MSPVREERPKSYRVVECGDFDTGWTHGQIFHGYSRAVSGSIGLAPAESGGWEHSLDEVLEEIRSPDFLTRLSRLRSGREDAQFGADISLAKLIRHLRAGGSGVTAAVERLLDNLFEDLRKGDEFAHTELAMAVLFALQRADSPLFGEVAAILSRTRAAELGRLSRYAKRLLGR